MVYDMYQDPTPCTSVKNDVDDSQIIIMSL